MVPDLPALMPGAAASYCERNALTATPPESGRCGVGWASREMAVVCTVNSLPPKGFCLISQKGSLIGMTRDAVSEGKLNTNSQAKLHYPLASIHPSNSKESDSTREQTSRFCPSRIARQFFIPKGREELMSIPH